jgi:hypothetical protein
VTDATISTGVDEDAEVPIGSGTSFDVSTARLYSYVMLHNVPLDSEIVFDWTYLDLQGNLIPIYDVVIGNTDGTGAIWAWLDIENEIPAGRYESQLYINGELYSASPFTIGLTEFVNERLALSFSYPSAWNIDQSDPTLITLSPRPGFVSGYFRDSGARKPGSRCLGSDEWVRFTGVSGIIQNRTGSSGSRSTDQV